MQRLVLVAVILLFVCGCPTPYQRKDFIGGYTNIQLDKNIFRVSFKGNKFTSKERASDLALLRCAEVSLHNGYFFFAIVKNDSYALMCSSTSPSTSTTHGTAHIMSDNSITGNATTRTSGSETVYYTTNPTETNTIVCFRQKPKDIYAYDARIVFNKITEAYGIETDMYVSIPKESDSSEYAVSPMDSSTPKEDAEISQVDDAEITDKEKTTAERLKELQELRKNGLITEHEYQTKRSEIIDGI